MSATTWRTERARLASATYRNHPDKADEARRNLRALRAEEYLQKVLSDAPPLNPDQLARLRNLLADRSGGRAA